jgi:hypothetical protein
MSTCRPPASRNFPSMISHASTRDLLETNFRSAPFLPNMPFLFQRVTLSSLVGKSIRFFFVLEDRILFSRVPAGFEYYLPALVVSGPALVMSGPASRYFSGNLKFNCWSPKTIKPIQPILHDPLTMNPYSLFSNRYSLFPIRLRVPGTFGERLFVPICPAGLHSVFSSVLAVLARGSPAPVFWGLGVFIVICSDSFGICLHLILCKYEELQSACSFLGKKP